MLFALVREGKVVGIYKPGSDDEYQRVAAVFEASVDITDLYPQPAVGWYFDGVNLTQQDATKAVDWRISKYAFNARMTMAEMTAILSAANTNFTVGALLHNQSVANYIDLSWPQTSAAVGLLVALGLLTGPRATQILTTPPVSTELQFPPGE